LADRKSLFGAYLDPLTAEETVQAIDERISRGLFTQHAVVNVAKIVNMQDDLALRDAVNACDIINVDGAGVVVAARMLGVAVPERVAGIDLFERLLNYAEEKQRAVFLLGATDSVIRDTVKVVKAKHPDIVIGGYHHGYFWDDEEAIVHKIQNSGSDLLFVGIVSPLKEKFIERWKNDLGVAFAMGVGGTFDVVSGKTKRAPKWMQAVGLEWFFRVLQEPRRMWKRYLYTNSRFAMMVLSRLLRRGSRAAR
jgi:N-acetylglucosaminyldiphosphoundecaprenol N-acetyl-beta-D-mannosaminyltransferase